MSANDEEGENIVCFICEQDLESANSNEIINVSRGLETLKKVSLERKDGRHKAFEDVNCIKVHVLCRKKYTERRNGKLKFDFSPANSNAWQFSPAKKKLRRSSDGFSEFSQRCFICSCRENNRQGRAGLLRKMTNPNVEVNFRRALESNILLKDELSKTVLQRISGLDLIVKGAVYHEPCYNKIMNLYLGLYTGTGDVGRPKMDLSSSMQKIYKYIEDTDDKVFTLQELVNLTGK